MVIYFLAAIVNPRSNIWFRSGINVGEYAMRNWMRQMCKTVGLVGDFTNKSGRVTALSRMSTGMVPRKAVASVTGHRDEKTLERYDRTLQLQQTLPKLFVGNLTMRMVILLHMKTIIASKWSITMRMKMCQRIVHQNFLPLMEVASNKVLVAESRSDLHWTRLRNKILFLKL
jgi:hypothetical protein